MSFWIYQDSLYMINVRNLFPKGAMIIEYTKIKPLLSRQRVSVTSKTN
jgi:hypothetical protein